MAPWNVSWPFGEASPDLPETISPSKGKSDSAFKVFIDGALTKIYNEANGRSKDNRAIREACKSVLGEPVETSQYCEVVNHSRDPYLNLNAARIKYYKACIPADLVLHIQLNTMQSSSYHIMCRWSSGGGRE